MGDPRPEERHSRRRSLQAIWNRIKREVGIEDVRAHDLWHTWRALASTAARASPSLGGCSATTGLRRRSVMPTWLTGLFGEHRMPLASSWPRSWMRLADSGHGRR